VVSILHVPRLALGIATASRGFASGLLRINEVPIVLLGLFLFSFYFF
jgi:hypothetical protein